MINLFKTLGTILVITFFSSCEDKPTPPVLSTTTVTQISTIAAVSGGNITDNGGTDIISKGVCWNTTTDPTIENSKTSDSGESLSFTSNISQLLPSTTYFVRAYAVNSAGNSYGESVSFKTLGDKPASNSQNASDIQLTTATLNGTVNPNLLETTVTFEYGTSTSYGSTAVAQQSPLSGDSDGNVSIDLTELAIGTTYHFRIKAENSLGITYSSDKTFTTLGSVPSATLENTTNIQVYSATLNGSVNPNYLSTIVTYEWGTTSSYGNTITPAQSPLTGSTDVSVSADLTGLVPGTTYHFRISAINELGTTNSNDMTFTTLGSVPSATTENATNILVNSVTLNGSVNPNYLSSTVTFEWGTTIDYGNIIAALQSPVTGTTSVNINAELAGLTPETNYHFRISAINELGTTNSADLEFTTYAAEDVDMNLYHSVTIESQIWLNENLKVTHFNNETDIPNIIDNTEWSNLATSSYCWYNNDEAANKNIYGALYNWYAVNTGNLCPTGWHVPTEAEWTTLIDNLGGKIGAANKLKETGATHWGSLNSATNETGFTALPAGDRGNNGEFGNLSFETFFWHSNEYASWGGQVTYIQLTPDADILPFDKVFGASVRCLKN